MAKILITGSADGLGHLAARILVGEGHAVVLHARSQERVREAMAAVPGSAGALVADLADMAQVKALAEQANALGRFDAVIHNAGVYDAPPGQILAVNLLAPYLLTCLMERPARLVYLTSGLHLHGQARPDALLKSPPAISYSDSKLYVTMLAMAVARLWPGVAANAVDPGWVPTKMGGPGAPDDLQQGAETQAWLAAGETPQAVALNGQVLFHKKATRCHPLAGDPAQQQRLLAVCERLTGVAFPTAR